MKNLHKNAVTPKVISVRIDNRCDRPRDAERIS